MTKDPFYYQPPAGSVEVLFADKDLLIVNKPAGLLTNPGRGPELADCLLSRVQQDYPTALLVNRLDLATSGLVVFALRRKAEAALKAQFANRTVAKTYLARIWQQPQVSIGNIDLPLIADLTAPPRNKVCLVHGKTALTHYRTLPDSGPNPLVLLSPTTGRAHQLRVHMQSIGHPILGDRLYGTAEVIAAAGRLLLHAMVLELDQPYSGQRLRFVAPADPAAFSLDDDSLTQLLLPVTVCNTTGKS